MSVMSSRISLCWLFVIASTVALPLLLPATARGAFDKALPYFNAGKAKSHRGDLDGAIKDYTRAIQLDMGSNKNNAVAYYNRGNVKRRKGDFDGAISDYTMAIKLQPAYPDAYNNRGNVRQEQGNLDAAIADYNHTIKFRPGDTYSYYSRALAYYDKGRWKEAINDCRKSIQLAPDSVDNYKRYRLCLLRMRNGESTAAITELKPFLGRIRQMDHNGWFYKVGSFICGDMSEDQFLKAARSSDRTQERQKLCEAYFYIGTVKLIKGQRSSAIRYLKSCVETRVTGFAEYRSARFELKRM